VPLTIKGETIGVVLRSRDGARPLYVSVGHRISLARAVDLVQATLTRFRLPEPTRVADKLSRMHP
jgi:deoxyribonuclease V